MARLSCGAMIIFSRPPLPFPFPYWISRFAVLPSLPAPIEMIIAAGIRAQAAQQAAQGQSSQATSR